MKSASVGLFHLPLHPPAHPHSIRRRRQKNVPADGGVAWLEAFDGIDYGYEAFLGEIGMLVMGRATYDQVRGFGAWPYPDHPARVLTSRPLHDAPTGVTAWGDGVEALATRLRDEPRDVWIVGGAQTIAGLMACGAVDSLELFVMPLLLGNGIPLFKPPRAAPKLTCSDVTHYPNGVRRLVYDVAARTPNPRPAR